METAKPSPETGSASNRAFEGLILMLTASAGELLAGQPAEEAGEVRPDLAGARQMIDLLEVLQEKTHGNLVPSEAELLERCLFDLRMQFLAVQGRS